MHLDSSRRCCFDCLLVVVSFMSLASRLGESLRGEVMRRRWDARRHRRTSLRTRTEQTMNVSVAPPWLACLPAVAALVSADARGIFELGRRLGEYGRERQR